MPGTEIFQAIDYAQSTDELLDLLSEFFNSYGFGAVCYVLPKDGDTSDYRLYQRGMPPEWMARYERLKFGEIDPIPDHTMATGEVDTLYNVLEKAVRSDEQKAYRTEFQASGVTDGLAMPTHGRKRSRGFFGLAQVRQADLDAVDRSLMHAVAQHAHWKFDLLTSDEKADAAKLSPRELEILTWIAAGKSNPDIATILGISMPTVATHLKRLFAKLGVNDRVSAALKGYKLGLIAD